MDRSSREKIIKETLDLNGTLDQINLTGIYKIFHPKAAEYTFFSRAHGRFSRTDHMIGCKVSFNKFKKVEITSNIFAYHNAMRLEIKYKKNCKKHKNMEAKQYTTKGNRSVKKTKKKFKNAWRQMKMKTQ